MVAKVMEGIAVKAGQLLPAGFHGVSTKMKPDPYDPDTAKMLLKEAGYGNGFEMTIFFDLEYISNFLYNIRWNYNNYFRFIYF